MTDWSPVGLPDGRGGGVFDFAGVNYALPSTKICASYAVVAPLLLAQQPSTCVGGVVVADVAGRVAGYISAVDGCGWSLTLIGVESERYFGGDDKGSHSFFNSPDFLNQHPSNHAVQKIPGAFLDVVDFGVWPDKSTEHDEAGESSQGLSFCRLMFGVV